MQLMTSLLGIAATANGKGYSMNKCGLDIGNSSRQAGTAAYQPPALSVLAPAPLFYHF